MIPLRDNNPSSTTPIVNYALILICSLAFLAQLGEGPESESLIERFGMVPARVSDPDEEVVQVREVPVRTLFGVRLQRVEEPLAPAAVPPFLTLLTCIFLHGGWMHIIGNLWFLFIFGDNIEDRLGHIPYLIFYLFSGIAASVAHYLVDPSSTIPTIGASGAIAGVMGAYLVLYPRATVVTLVPIFVFLQVMVLPASIFLGIWFLIQFFQGTFAMGSTQSAGVAWWAHIGGFVVGFAAAMWVRSRGEIRPRVRVVRRGRW